MRLVYLDPQTRRGSHGNLHPRCLPAVSRSGLKGVFAKECQATAAQIVTDLDHSKFCERHYQLDFGNHQLSNTLNPHFKLTSPREKLSGDNWCEQVHVQDIQTSSDEVSLSSQNLDLLQMIRVL
eukprot:TRINITY_DN15159_c0_g1_i1.p1 TRINITY_DN15159_c0_g1~~TRINITY_DN15159_c0_g1_i1.p1  ORF type:complete len:124 (-),score=10.77 TRINITY_DN15159_c0_g1_i1:280-651(-)